MSFVKRSKRKTVTIDRAVADTIKEISMRHGVSINSYMKSLIEAVKELEDLGLYAPTAIRDIKSIATLSRLGMAMIPTELLNHIDSDGDTIVNSGIRIGRALKEIKADVGKAIEFLGTQYRVLIPIEDRVIVVGSGKSGAILANIIKGIVLIPIEDRVIVVGSGKSGTILANIIKGIASGGGLEISDEGGIITIKIEKKQQQ